ncbi:NADP-dependent oxidoreductase [Spirosoma radiotolerans]|uniref:Oxidoreductase n=1 Tax=Spirosoma radiotolerans TaxID=1379870 RepID=A0A0E3V6I6_9BACT|nr:NADP-dependent oxidoreductase [Spirosoma radiotolerans]AKD54571.1 oxidoreductase [Spirosoma radiotolerans]
MKAVVLSDWGGAENFTVQDIPTPAIKPDEVLVKVKAFGVNPADFKTRSGAAPYSKDYSHPIVLGWDMAGEVVEAGTDVTTFKPGDAVYGMVNFPKPGQAYAEYVAAPAAHLALKPATLSFEEAAAAPLAVLTAWQALTEHGQLKAGENVLIQAASGGVGHLGVQLAKALGAYVIGTASGKNEAFVRSLGADAFIDYTQTSVEESVSDIDLVFDTAGADTIMASAKVLKPNGRLISIAYGAMDKVLAVRPDIRAERILVHTSGDDLRTINEFIDADKLKISVSEVLPASQIADAHQKLESRRTTGKIVLTFS